MLSSSPSSLSALSSPQLSLKSPSPPAPSRSRYQPRLATTTANSCSYTCTEEPRSTCPSPRGTTSFGSLYEILGIPAAATSQDIKDAYRRLARVCHPDVAGTDRKDSSADEFMTIHAAYRTLSDPEKRAVYDQKLFRRIRPLTTVVPGFSGYTGRNWETDQCW